jgi:hypothetical protein
VYKQQFKFSPKISAIEENPHQDAAGRPNSAAQAKKTGFAD